jgi:hypothetical protein
MTQRAIAIPEWACYTAVEGRSVAPYPKAMLPDHDKEMLALVIPTALLRRFYDEHTLRNTDQGVEFRLRNRVAPATLVAAGPLEIDGVVVPSDRILLQASKPRLAAAINTHHPFPMPMGQQLTVRVIIPPLSAGAHRVRLHVVTREVGPVIIEFNDHV